MVFATFAAFCALGQERVHRDPLRYAIKLSFIEVNEKYDLRGDPASSATKVSGELRLSSFVGIKSSLLQDLYNAGPAAQARATSAPLLRATEGQPAIAISGVTGWEKYLVVTVVPRPTYDGTEMSVTMSDSSREALDPLTATWSITSKGVDGPERSRMFTIQQPGRNTVIVFLTAHVIEAGELKLDGGGG